MQDTRHLQDKTVILKMAGVTKAVSTSVVHVELDGLWFSGGSLLGEMVQAEIPRQGMKSPAVFVPFSQIQYLIAESA
jgi:hypothetical protein